MNEEKKKALKVINARTKRLLDELEIEKEDMLDEPRIAYLMQEIRANKTLLNIIEKLQKENEELKFKERRRIIGKYGDTEIHDVINKTLSNDYISAKKIKDKIEELKINLVNMQGEELLIYESKIDILQELLGKSEE
jgi:hypothetical protein